MSRINLFYLSPNTTGGWVTFTSNLIEALHAAGVETKLYKVGNRTELRGRPFGYDKTYQNLDGTDALNLCIHEPCLIVAAAKKFKDIADEMMSFGAKIVVHDPTELKNLPPVEFMQDKAVVIRKTGLRMLSDATFIRHPYSRQCVGENYVKSKLCVSTSRIDFDKHTNMLLDANRALNSAGLPPIEIRGFENRLYTKFKIMPEYPEWEQSVAAYPRERGAAIEILKSAAYAADMSVIKGDGGGTQYTFLEAWDAGAVPIINREWVLPDDDMIPGFNCLAVESGWELADMLKTRARYEDGTRDELRDCGYESLKKHDPELIGQQYRNFMGV